MLAMAIIGARTEVKLSYAIPQIAFYLPKSMPLESAAEMRK